MLPPPPQVVGLLLDCWDGSEVHPVYSFFLINRFNSEPYIPTSPAIRQRNGASPFPPPIKIQETAFLLYVVFNSLMFNLHIFNAQLFNSTTIQTLFSSFNVVIAHCAHIDRRQAFGNAKPFLVSRMINILGGNAIHKKLNSSRVEPPR
jgi:hypothetical protein